MCIIEFVDFNATYTEGVEAPVVAAEAKPKTRRSRKKATDAAEDAQVVGEKKAVKTAPKAAKTSAPKATKKTNVGKKM
jgi:large subunit ribosomal protein L17